METNEGRRPYGRPAGAKDSSVARIHRLIHDARQPIAGVTAILEAIKSDGSISADVRSMAHWAAAEARSALDLFSASLPPPPVTGHDRSIAEAAISDLAAVVTQAVSGLTRTHPDRLIVDVRPGITVGYGATPLATAINTFVSAGLRHGHADQPVHVRAARRAGTAHLAIEQPTSASIRPGWVDTAGLLTAIAVIARGGGTTSFGRPGHTGVRMRLLLPIARPTDLARSTSPETDLS